MLPGNTSAVNTEATLDVASTAPMIVPLSDARDVSLVGGKAINLCRLIDADLPVPQGFVVTTGAYRMTGGQGLPQELSKELQDQIRDAYAQLDETRVAVRSSATAEDLAEASLAGQYDTFLDVVGADDVIAAVGKCWASLGNDRVGVYLEENGIDASEVAVAVVVQEMVPADVSGVLFTVNPHTGADGEMLIEAVYGLGEGIVSGEIQPDVYRVQRDGEEVLDIHVARKTQALIPGHHDYQPVSSEKASKACMTYEQLQSLRVIGQKIHRYFDGPQDVEWAMVGDRVRVLQSRPITTLSETRAHRALLEQTREALTAEHEQDRGPWVRHNLSETLPLPSPLTWSLIQSFMSGSGGFGRMHEQVGFKPSDQVKEEGFLSLIGGEIFMDCSRVSEMFAEGYPFRYDTEELRKNPDAAQQPPSVPNGGFKQLSEAARLGAEVTQNLRDLAQTLDKEFDDVLTPRVQTWCQTHQGENLAELTDDELVAHWQAQQDTVLNDFGAAAFMPSMIEALSAADLKAFLAEHLWDDPETLLRQLSVGTKPDSTLLSNIELQKVARGERSAESWLKSFGHRGPGEFDIASPRWAERPEELQNLASQLKGAEPVETRHHECTHEAEQCLVRLAKQLNSADAKALRSHVELVQRYARFREDGKALLILAFNQLRKTALEFGRRLGIGDTVFFLKTDELTQALEQGFVPQDRIAQRQLDQRVAKRIRLPHLIEAGDIQTLGEPKVLDNADSWPAFPVASGSCTGPARIVFDPTQTHDLGEGYVLVCPSTDPAWTPLFIKAAGLVLERGGGLSHGAIVARELGLPAVVLENATQLIKDGEVLTLNGDQGQIARGGEGVEQAEVDEAENVEIDYAMRPPQPGAKEKLSGQMGLLAALLWGVVLGVIFLAPPTLFKEPAFALIDAVLWPLVSGLGMVGAVGVVGVFFALIPLLIQKYATDNERLIVAKKRGALLRKKAAVYPAGSPRRKTMQALISPITGRTLKASMASLAWVLGPMVLIFFWMPDRMDPASWNADGGVMVTIVAELDGDFQGQAVCVVPEGLAIESMTPATQSLPPIRSTLEEIRREWRKPGELASYPWPVQAAGEQAQQILLGSLTEFLQGSIPPQKLNWMVRVPDDAAGHYTVDVSFVDASLEQDVTQPITLAFGQSKPPAKSLITGAHTPLIQLEAIYPRALKKRQFWTPLASIGGPGWDFGWLGTYIVFYLAAMIIVKQALKVA